MPTHQPVGFVSGEDWVQPLKHQLRHSRLTKAARCLDTAMP
ncbi:hypothetical protein SynRS9902_01660 [Synechococcus sp. RS9902]|nr:hypothetical protein SynRS9902_01660 [Synechococcus sp. RS9902]